MIEDSISISQNIKSTPKSMDAPKVSTPRASIHKATVNKVDDSAQIRSKPTSKSVDNGIEHLESPSPIKIDDAALFETDKKFVDRIEREISRANEGIKFIHKEFAYRKHEASNRFYVQILDSSTQEVLREIPSERDLDIVAKIRELTGLIVDKKI